MVGAEGIDRLAAEVRGFFAANADPAVVAKYARYFREGYDAYGIDSKVFDAQATHWAETYGAELGLAGCLQLGDRLFAGGKYEEGALAVRLVKGYRQQLDSAAAARLGGWLERVQNWAHTDVICGELLAPALRDGQIALSDLAQWRDSPHRFKRRAVPVTMLGPLKKKGDLWPLLEFIRPMMLDPERVVHQGLGWFLREAWKVEPQPVEAFLTQWKDSAARLIFQYATEKMSAADKERFRRAKRA